MDINKLKHLSGIATENYDAGEKIDKIHSNLVNLLKDFQHHAANLASEQEMNEIYDWFLSDLKKRIDVLEQGGLL
jgi:hemerythrin